MNNLLHRSKIFMNRNASTILTCMGGIGTVATAVMAVRVTPKALDLLEKAEEKKGEALTKMEKVKVAAPVYVPSVLVGVSTLACIFGANVMGKRQQASMISAYALLENSYKEHKKKVEEQGTKQESKGKKINSKFIPKISAQKRNFSRKKSKQLLSNELE